MQYNIKPVKVGLVRGIASIIIGKEFLPNALYRLDIAPNEIGAYARLWSRANKSPWHVVDRIHVESPAQGRLEAVANMAPDWKALLRENEDYVPVRRIVEYCANVY